MASKILVVEDDNYARDIYQEILTDAGFTVTTANNGEEGLAKLVEGGYDLVLLDVMMPKLDGLEVLKSLKAQGKGKNNGKIILLTNLAHDPIIKEALDTGATDYLIKSDLNPDQLLEHVKKHLG